NTLRRAISTLVAGGLLVRTKGVGTRVQKQKILRGASSWLSCSEVMRILGIDIHTIQIQLIRHAVSAEVAAFFGIEVGTKVMRLERLRGKKDAPFVYFISEFSPQIPISASENFNRPLYEILERDYGVVAFTSKEEISAAAADPFIA